MAISHAFSNAVPDATGTLTIWYGATTATVAATDIVRPSNWNSAHDQFLTIAGNTAGQSTFSGSNIVIGGGPNITISGVNATRFDISAGAGGAGDGFNRIAAGSQTAGTNTTVVFANSNGITFGMSDSSQVTASHNGLTSQSNQNVTAANGGFAFQTLSFSNVNGVSFGTSAGSAITASHNGLTTARASNDGIGLNTAQSNVTWTVNSNGLSLDARGYAGTGTTFNGANVSGSMTVNSVGVQLSLSALAGGGETRLTAYAQSNTTQSSSGTIPLSSLNFAGAGIASVGITNGSVVVSVPAGGGAGDGGVFAGVSTGGNTAGSTGTVSTGNFVLVGSQGITLSQSTAAAGSNATITILGAAPQSRFWHGAQITNVASQQSNSVVSICPFQLPWDLACSNVRFGVSINVGSAANNSSAFCDISLSAVLYSRNASTLSSILSASASFTQTWTSNATGSVTGAFQLPATFAATTLTGGEYFWALHISSTNTATGGAATTALGNSISLMAAVSGGTAAQGLRLWQAGTNSTQGGIIGLGAISTGATRGTLAVSDITQTGSRAVAANVFFEMRNQAIY